MKSKLLYTALLFLFSCSDSQTQVVNKWEEVGTDLDSNSYYINPTYVFNVKDDKGNDYLKAWVKNNQKKFTDRFGKKYDTVEFKQLLYVDCANHRMKILSKQYNKLSGEHIDGVDLPLDETNPWSEIAPGTVGEMMEQSICHLKK